MRKIIEIKLPKWMFTKIGKFAILFTLGNTLSLIAIYYAALIDATYFGPQEHLFTPWELSMLVIGFFNAFIFLMFGAMWFNDKVLKKIHAWLKTFPKIKLTSK